MVMAYNKQMDIMREWISQNRKWTPPKDILLALSDVSNHTVAVKVLNVIPVTYSLIATVRHTKVLQITLYLMQVGL